MFSKLVKASFSRKTKEQAILQPKEEARIVEIVTELHRLMDLKAPISEEQARRN